MCTTPLQTVDDPDVRTQSFSLFWSLADVYREAFGEYVTPQPPAHEHITLDCVLLFLYTYSPKCSLLSRYLMSISRLLAALPIYLLTQVLTFMYRYLPAVMPFALGRYWFDV